MYKNTIEPNVLELTGFFLFSWRSDNFKVLMEVEEKAKVKNLNPSHYFWSLSP